MDGSQGKALLVAITVALGAATSAAVNADVARVEALEFSRVQLVGSGELEITQGEANTLKIRGDGDDLDLPPFVVQGDMLRLGVSPQGNSVSDVQFKLTVTDLAELLLAGSGDVFVKPLDVGDLLVSVDGSGVILCSMYGPGTLRCGCWDPVRSRRSMLLRAMPA